MFQKEPFNRRVNIERKISNKKQTNRLHLGSDDESEESEGIDQTTPSNPRQADVSYGTLAGQNTSEQLDPFKKIINPRDPYYKKRNGGHK